MMFVILFSVKRSDGKSRVNNQPLQYCIQSQKEEGQIEEADGGNQRRGGPRPETNGALTARRLSSVGIVGRQGTIKTSARMHQRDKTQKMRQKLLQPQEEVMS